MWCDGATVEVKGVLLDNRHIVLYNRDLIVKFQSHINVEIYNHLRSIKYLFKCVNKGCDKSTIVIEQSGNPAQP